MKNFEEIKKIKIRNEVGQSEYVMNNLLSLQVNVNYINLELKKKKNEKMAEMDFGRYVTRRQEVT